MTVERHLIIQELSLRPSGEWKPDGPWTVVRVAEGAGYCLQGSAARELNAGDAVITGPATNAVFRASPARRAEAGIFSRDAAISKRPAHRHRMASIGRSLQPERAAHSLFRRERTGGAKVRPARRAAAARRIAHAVGAAPLWASSIAGLLPAPTRRQPSAICVNAFRTSSAKCPETELATRSLSELAEQLHCSERHFSRLFREEFGVSFRARQIELRLQRAQQLLAIPTRRSSTWPSTAAIGISACSTPCSKSALASRPANGGSRMSRRREIFPRRGVAMVADVPAGGAMFFFA